MEHKILYEPHLEDQVDELKRFISSSLLKFADRYYSCWDCKSLREEKLKNMCKISMCIAFDSKLLLTEMNQHFENQGFLKKCVFSVFNLFKRIIIPKISFVDENCIKYFKEMFHIEDFDFDLEFHKIKSEGAYFELLNKIKTNCNNKFKDMPEAGYLSGVKEMIYYQHNFQNYCGTLKTFVPLEILKNVTNEINVKYENFISEKERELLIVSLSIAKNSFEIKN